MTKPLLNSEQICELLPHRFPLLLVDRVLEIGDDSIVAEKLVSANEPHFVGHFPGRPIMPGVLLIEAMAQSGGIWVLYTKPAMRGRGVALAGITKARFRRPVVPGDIVTLHTRVLRTRGDVIQMESTASVLGETAAESQITAAFVDWEDTV
jgi:beta-hydroxyacyl-ACP dehydratase FabZ